MTEQNEETFKSIKDNAGEKYNFQELHINRVPDPAVNKLQELAYDMFAGDYGATLAYLLELHELREEFDAKLVATNQKVVELEDRLNKLIASGEDKTDEQESKKKDTLQ